MAEFAPIKTPDADDLAAIAAAAGPGGVVDEDAYAPHLTEWRGRWTGATPMIVAPGSTAAVAAVVTACAERRIAVTPQGGNTGLVGGQIPSGPEILLTLKRMRTIRDVSPLDNAMTLDAGVTLAEAQNAAQAADRLFPLSIGSEGSCQIGGVISTNAGGVNVLRYGNTRDLVLGLEVVTPSGAIWNGLKSLRKDNVGYDLKHLVIGGEGTLGVVTAAVVKLFPCPEDVETVFVGVPNPQAAVSLLARVQAATGGAASSFELISRAALALVVKNIPGARDPLSAAHPWYVLAEFSGPRAANLRAAAESALGDALDADEARDATIAESEAQRHDFWRLRHAISEALNQEGAGVRCDVSVPTARIPAFLEAADAAVAKAAPGAVVVAFGHVGDGNIHYDVAPPPGAPDALVPLRNTIESDVYDVIERFDGSISAEHGVGRHRLAEMRRRKSPVELEMMEAVKRAIDPHGIMNPGKSI